MGSGAAVDGFGEEESIDVLMTGFSADLPDPSSRLLISVERYEGLNELYIRRNSFASAASLPGSLYIVRK